MLRPIQTASAEQGFDCCWVFVINCTFHPCQSSAGGTGKQGRLKREMILTGSQSRAPNPRSDSKKAALAEASNLTTRKVIGAKFRVTEPAGCEDQMRDRFPDRLELLFGRQEAPRQLGSPAPSAASVSGMTLSAAAASDGRGTEPAREASLRPSRGPSAVPGPRRPGSAGKSGSRATQATARGIPGKPQRCEGQPGQAAEARLSLGARSPRLSERREHVSQPR